MLRRTVLDRISSQRSLSLSDADTRSVDSKDDSRDDTPHLDDKMRAVLLMPSFRLVPGRGFTSGLRSPGTPYTGISDGRWPLVL